jgi:phosphoglycerate dehydrogenase-like enzyme
MHVLISIQQPVHAWQIPTACVDRLRRRFPDVNFTHATDDDTRARALADCDVAYTWIMSREEAAAARCLRWVHTSAVAVETLPLPDLFGRGILVSNTRGVQARPIAEHVMAVLLALAKQLPFVLRAQGERRWVQNELVDGRLPWLLHGRTLGLIGVGTIGAKVAELARSFGMRVLAMRRRREAVTTGVDEVLGPGDLHRLLGIADAVVVAAPLTPETTNLLGAAEFRHMKRGAVLVNVGRARIIDHDALIEALHTEQLGGAALDVFPQEPLPADHPLWSTPNVILTPHTSGFRQGHWDEVIEVFADNLERFRTGEPLRYRIDPVLGY